MKNNMVGWFEIPVKDMDRAINFYETIFDIKIQKQDLDGLLMGWFPFAEDGLGAAGSLVKHDEFYAPSQNGVLIYFTAHSGDLKNELSKVEGAGGKVLQEKKLISEDIGYMGLFIDTEGNRIAIHSRG